MFFFLKNFVNFYCLKVLYSSNVYLKCSYTSTSFINTDIIFNLNLLDLLEQKYSYILLCGLLFISHYFVQFLLNAKEKLKTV